MEFLRRLRFLWSLAFLLVAGTLVYVMTVQPTIQTLCFFITALVLALGPYLHAGWLHKLSFMWLVGGGAFAAGSALPSGAPLIFKAVGFVAILWFFTIALLWLFSGLFSGRTE